MQYLKCFVFAVLAACGTFVGLAEDCTHEFGPWTVVTEATKTSAGTHKHTCGLCGACFKMGCPAMTRGAEIRPGCFQMTIDPNLCAGCKQCQQVCKFGAITRVR